MSDMDQVTVKMPGYIADALAKVLVEEAHRDNDQGWAKLAEMLRGEGEKKDQDHEVSVTRITVIEEDEPDEADEDTSSYGDTY